MKKILLTPEQYSSLGDVILANLSESTRYLYKQIDIWWKDNILGYLPYRVERTGDREFEIYDNPE